MSEPRSVTKFSAAVFMSYSYLIHGLVKINRYNKNRREQVKKKLKKKLK